MGESLEFRRASRKASDEIAGDTPAATDNANVEVSLELWFASRGMPRMANLDALLGVSRHLRLL